MTNIPDETMATTNHLRAAYANSSFSFGNPAGGETICIVGSCRIVPILNYFRAFNSLCGHPFEIICLNPVEMWDGPGHEVANGVNRCLSGYRFGKVNHLICEHLQFCGVLNTADGAEQSIFPDLGCAPGAVWRIPNWHGMLFYDSELAMFDKERYGAMERDHKIAELRGRMAGCREKFLGFCERSSFPDLASWAATNWLDTRLGWTLDHVSRSLTWRVFEHVAGAIGIEISQKLAGHPFCVCDPYASTGTALTELDIEANEWRFRP